MDRQGGERYIAWRAGPLQGYFDTQTGGLRTITWAGRCVWRELVMLVRSHTWETMPTLINRLDQDIGVDSFHIQFAANSHQGPIDFRWAGSITGSEEGVIRYEFNGQAATEFLANRIGFCLLHPCELYAGEPIRQHRTSGETLESRFPALIEPQILGRFSIRDLTGLDHQVQPGVWGEARFEGDVFETEDQRNWSDASFKTYCTP